MRQWKSGALALLLCGAAAVASAQYVRPGTSGAGMLPGGQGPRMVEYGSNEVRVPSQPPPIHLTLRTERSSYDAGDDMVIQVRPDRDSYIYLFATDRGGTTRLVFPNAFQKDHFLRGGVSRMIPLQTYRLLADGPAGRETLTAVATTDRYDWLHEALPREGRAREDRGFMLSTISPEDLHERLAESTRREYEARVGDYRSRVERRRDRARAAGTRVRLDDIRVPALPAAGMAETRVRVRDPRGFTQQNQFRYRSAERRQAVRRIPPVTDYHVGHTGMIEINSIPPRAYVTIDGHYVGTTPLVFEAPLGRRDIVVDRPGYEPWERRVRVRDDVRSRHRVILEQW